MINYHLFIAPPALFQTPALWIAAEMPALRSEPRFFLPVHPEATSPASFCLCAQKPPLQAGGGPGSCPSSPLPGLPAPQLGGPSSAVLPEPAWRWGGGRHPIRALQPSPRRPGPWAGQASPGRSLGERAARVEAARLASAVWRGRAGGRLTHASSFNRPGGRCEGKAPRRGFLWLPPPTPPGSPFQVARPHSAIRGECLLFCALFTALGRRVINLAQP